MVRGTHLSKTAKGGAPSVFYCMPPLRGWGVVIRSVSSSPHNQEISAYGADSIVSHPSAR